MRLSVFYLFIVIILSSGCQKKIDQHSLLLVKKMALSNEEIAELLSTKIYFAHMSVGYNILSGLQKLIAQDPRLGNWKIQDLATGGKIEAPAFYHSRNGKNGDPKSKCDAFRNFLLENNLGEKLDIAFFKFCYVDFNRDTDVEAVFDYYCLMMDSIKMQFPELQIIHVTTPLTAHAWSLKGWLKNLLRSDIPNVKRNRFNALLEQKFQPLDPIYDLAEVEARLPEGKLTTFRYHGQNYLALAAEYTDDGGHLNETGRLFAAQALLNTLAMAIKNK